KGMGDLFDNAEFLKPFAVTAVIGYRFPTRITSNIYGTDPDTGATTIDKERHANVLEWGGSIQYSLPYLQAFVRDLGDGQPFKGLIPLVEFAMETPTNRMSGRTTGTINPGLIWSGRYFQVAAEALLPINAASGRGVGGIVQLHFYLDDIFPGSLGKPIFGN